MFHADRLCLGVDQSVIDVLLGGDSMFVVAAGLHLSVKCLERLGVFLRC